MENTTPNGWTSVDTSSDSTAVQPEPMAWTQKYGATLAVAQMALNTLHAIDDPRFTLVVKNLRESLTRIESAPVKYDW